MPVRLFNILPIAFLLMVALSSQAQGDLLITPKRLVFDGTKRAEEINLANIGKDTTTYSISFVQFKMDEAGVFTSITEEDSSIKFANKNLRFFPRTVTLAPGEAQTVKVQLIKANELANGEYRSHLSFKNVWTSTPLGEEAKPGPKEQGISVNLTPVFGISIATIIRVGETNVEGTMTDQQFHSATATTDPWVSFKLNRSGNISLYGDVRVNYVDQQNKTTEVALMKGLAVYTPNTYRKVQLPLKSLVGNDYRNGKLVIEYVDPSSKNASICNSEIVF